MPKKKPTKKKTKHSIDGKPVYLKQKKGKKPAFLGTARVNVDDSVPEGEVRFDYCPDPACCLDDACRDCEGTCLRDAALLEPEELASLVNRVDKIIADGLSPQYHADVRQLGIDNPGSWAAEQLGCTCPHQDELPYVTVTDCPVHGCANWKHRALWTAWGAFTLLCLLALAALITA